MKKQRAPSIGYQLGAVCLLVVALLGVVCAVVLRSLEGMRTDSRRLLEETDEHALTSSVLVQIDMLEAWFAAGAGAPGGEGQRLAHARALVGSIQQALPRLEGDPEKDPSREEHEDVEEENALGLTRHLTEFLAALEAEGQGQDAGTAAEHLAAARALAAHLHEETQNESRAANRDLVARGRYARGMMIATVGCAGLTLAGTFLYVLRSVVRPLRELQRGVEGLGKGDLGQRIQVRGEDEIGELGRAFNGMADRIQGAQTDLEQRVATRTRDFLRAARLADLGVLAAGVAHEVNNPLASIASCAEGLERRLRTGHVDPKEESEYLRTIAAEAYRAREITAQLLSLAGQERGEPAPVDVALVLRGVQIATRHLLEQRGQSLAIETHGELDLLGSGTELTQVLVNLILNARDASPAGEEIRLTCAGSDGELVCEVRDRGSGIPPEDLERIFDPFFTTKRPGKGTGLGLSVVAALVEARGGRIAVESQPGQGTSFRVTFPRAEERA
jgi:signal transduction histidine kinase